MTATARNVTEAARARRGNGTKYLLIYLVYAAVILAAGAKLGVFSGPKMVPAGNSINPRQTPGSAAPGTIAQPAPLPNGILAFDNELKQVTVHEGESEAHFVFRLNNGSREPVIIEKVETSCGCTAAKLPPLPWTLKPREKGEIQVTMSVHGQSGTTSKNVGVFTSLGYKMLTVEAAIQPSAKTQ